MTGPELLELRDEAERLATEVDNLVELLRVYDGPGRHSSERWTALQMGREAHARLRTITSEMTKMERFV